MLVPIKFLNASFLEENPRFNQSARCELKTVIEATAHVTISRGITSPNSRQGWSVYYLAIERENNIAASNLHFVQGVGCFSMSLSRNQNIHACYAVGTLQQCS